MSVEDVVRTTVNSLSLEDVVADHEPTMEDHTARKRNMAPEIKPESGSIKDILLPPSSEGASRRRRVGESLFAKPCLRLCVSHHAIGGRHAAEQALGTNL